MYKTTNERTRRRNEQKLIDTENVMVVTRGKGGQGVEGKGGQLHGDGRRCDFGSWAHNASMQVMHHRIVHLKPM